MEKYKFFSNAECEFFPCHKCVGEAFNCLFCYCPLYALGDKCGGNFIYLENGVKSCENCLIPHSESGYEYIMGKISDVCNMAKNKS